MCIDSCADKCKHSQLSQIIPPPQKKRPNQTLKKYLKWNILESGGIINIRKDIKAS